MVKQIHRLTIFFTQSLMNYLIKSLDQLSYLTNH